jgi:V8-like Glu-specific endopeptidase
MVVVNDLLASAVPPTSFGRKDPRMSHRPPWYRRTALGRAVSGRLSRDTALLMSWTVMVAVGSTASAAALTGDGGMLGTSYTVHDTRPFAAIGAIFRGAVSSSGHHFCSAGVVDSPRADVIVTAAHCVSDGIGDLFFAPGYHDGTAPYGVWRLDRVTVDPRWTAGQDPDVDVAFATVSSPDGREVQDVVGGYRVGSGLPTHGTVRLTGYPSASDAPLTCVNRITAYTTSQLRIACTAYSGGTSGSPWVVDEHTVVGVIGGFQQGGSTPDVSYSAYFGEDITALYRQALATA